MVGEARRPVARPGREGLHELNLVDQAVLEGKQSKKEMAINGHETAPKRSGRSGKILGIQARPRN
jgi:hypothetical protein